LFEQLRKLEQQMAEVTALQQLGFSEYEARAHLA
jgi:hypothetical protein